MRVYAQKGINLIRFLFFLQIRLLHKIGQSDPEIACGNPGQYPEALGDVFDLERKFRKTERSEAINISDYADSLELIA